MQEILPLCKQSPQLYEEGEKWLQTMFWDLISRTSIAIHCMAKMAEWFSDNILFWRSHIQGIDRLAKMTNDSEQEDRWSHYTLHRSSPHQGEIVGWAHKKDKQTQTHDHTNTETHWPTKIPTHKKDNQLLDTIESQGLVISSSYRSHTRECHVFHIDIIPTWQTKLLQFHK